MISYKDKIKGFRQLEESIDGNPYFRDLSAVLSINDDIDLETPLKSSEFNEQKIKVWFYFSTYMKILEDILGCILGDVNI